MGVSDGIEQILNACVSLFDIIYSGGTSLFRWFSTPIQPTGDSFIDMFLQAFIGYTPLELSFGVMLGSVLFMALLGFARSVIGSLGGGG